MKVTLKNVRLGTFPALEKAEQFQGEGEPKFKARFIFPPNHPQIAELRAAEEAVAKAKWPKDWQKILNAAKANGKESIQDGSKKPDAPGHEGMLFINASNTKQNKPKLKNRDATDITWADGIIYPGCYVVGYLEAWAQDNGFGKRVNWGLRGVQYYARGDAFGGGSAPVADSDVEDLGTEEAGIDPTA